MLAVQSRYRHYRGKIPRAWDCVSAWELQRPLRSRVPISLEVVRFLFASACSWALEEKSQGCMLFSLAIFLLLGYHGMMRPGELLNLKVEDLSSSHTGAPLSLAIAIRTPQIRKHGGRHQFVLIEDRHAIAWAEWLVQSIPTFVEIWPSSPARFRSLFRSSAQMFVVQS